MLQAMDESPGIMLLRGQYQHFKKDHAKENTWGDIIYAMFMDGRNTDTFMQGNKQDVFHQGLGLKQSLELKSLHLTPWCTLTHVLWGLDIHCTYSLNAEYFLLTEYILLDLRTTNFNLSKTIAFQETVMAAIFWKRVTPRHWQKKYTIYPVCKGSHKHTHMHRSMQTNTHTHTRTHTHTYTHSLLHE